MQFKSKIIISISVFIILGLLTFFLLRKKSIPGNDPVEEPDEEPDEEPAERMGWPTGTEWNLRGPTGGDTQRCNDICKELGYNYFTHNPPPAADGGCGCFSANVELSQLSMTDHANAKTRLVV